MLHLGRAQSRKTLLDHLDKGPLNIASSRGHPETEHTSLIQNARSNYSLSDLTLLTEPAARM